ncbi:hypothetical protein NPIL_405251, partial [Nephila pilipes]
AEIRDNDWIHVPSILLIGMKTQCQRSELIAASPEWYYCQGNELREGFMELTQMTFKVSNGNRN